MILCEREILNKHTENISNLMNVDQMTVVGDYLLSVVTYDCSSKTTWTGFYCFVSSL